MLRARAHGLEPVVIIGGKGLTEDVVKEVDRALTAHELIKVRAPSLDRDARDEALQTLCVKTGADAVQQIGKVFVLFRKKSE